MATIPTHLVESFVFVGVVWHVAFSFYSNQLKFLSKRVIIDLLDLLQATPYNQFVNNIFLASFVVFCKCLRIICVCVCVCVFFYLHDIFSVIKYRRTSINVIQFFCYRIPLFLFCQRIVTMAILFMMAVIEL